MAEKEKKRKSVSFLKFLVVGFVICYVASGIVWSIWLAIWFPSYFTGGRPQDHVNTLVLNILPLAALPLAISVISYGIFRRKMNPFGILLSSWYVSTGEVLTFFYIVLASAYGTRAYIPDLPLPEFAFFSFLIAGVLTIVYFVRKREKANASKET